MVRRNNVDFNVPERQSVAKWNQLRGLFRSLNSSNPRSGEDVPLRDLILRNQLDRLALKLNLSTRNSFSPNHWFGRYIDHLRTTIGADMRETLRFCRPCHSEHSEESLIISFGSSML